MKMDHHRIEQRLRTVARAAPAPAPARHGVRAHAGLVLAALLAAALAAAGGIGAHPLPRHTVARFSA